MDLHINELIFEPGYERVPMNSVSFRNIDQEFIVVHSADSFGSLQVNNLYYCFIKPYEGLFFRLIGVSDEEEKELRVDEDETEIDDTPYEKFADAVISKIIENWDLISNQLIVNMTFDYYGSNEDLVDLMETRELTWLDDIREEGNPDWIITQDGKRLKLIRCEGGNVIAESADGQQFLINQEGNISLH